VRIYGRDLFPLCRMKLVVIVACLFAFTLSAQPSPTEYQVKAAYLFNFGKFVKWPSAAGASFSICVLGTDPFGSILDTTVREEKIDGRQVVARRIVRPQEAAGCQIVFISRSEEGQARKFIPSLTKAGVLTVSDMPGFLDHGGMIQFTFVGNRIRFEVNLDAVRKLISPSVLNCLRWRAPFVGGGRRRRDEHGHSSLHVHLSSSYLDEPLSQRSCAAFG